MGDEKTSGGWLIPIVLVFGVVLLAGFFQQIPILGSLLALACAAGALALVFKRDWQDSVFSPLNVQGSAKRLAVLLLSTLFMVAVPGATPEKEVASAKPETRAIEEPEIQGIEEPAEPEVPEPKVEEPEPKEPEAPEVEKPEPKVAPQLIPYRIVNHETFLDAKVSYDVEVGLVDGKLPSKEQLAAISNKLVGHLSHENKFVGYFLAGVARDGYFATAHHLPDLEVKINSWALPDRYLALLQEPKPKGPYRTWASADGKFSTEARLLDHSDGTALLMRRNPWKSVSVPIARLAKADQDFIAGDTQQLLVGQVISIADGDTFRLRETENHSVRLEGIDAPEKKQDYGTQSRKALGKYIHGKKVRVRWSEKDRYGRILGQVIADGQWVNHRMVDDGWAWHFTEYSDDPDLAEAERLAREAKRGLWADPNEPMAPWDYRNRPKAEPEVSGLLGSPGGFLDSPKPQQAYWLNTSSNVRHNRSCKHYNNTKKGRPCSASEGKPCGICGG